MKIVVIGGTGLIGSKAAVILRERGHEVVAASPDTGVNSITGEGLKEATLRSFGGEVQGFSPLDAAVIRETITQGPGQGEYERFR